MRARIVLWSVGIVVGLALASAIPDSLFPGARLLAFVATILLTAIPGERWILPRLGGDRTAGASARDQRFPDGRVDISGMDRVTSEPNPFDPRFARFLGVTDSPGDRPSVPPRVPHALGRCPRLVGRVVIISIFLDRDRHAWSAQEIAQSHRAIIRAGEWVEQEAIRWNAQTNVEVAGTYLLERDDSRSEVEIEFQYAGGSLDAFERGEVRNAFSSLTAVAIRLGFQHGVELIETIETRVEADVVVWLLHPRRAGRSFAIPIDLPLAGAVNLAVCYPVQSLLPEPLEGPAFADPVTLVHELFHLFGATDKYNQSIRAFEPETVTGRDVMRLDEDRLSRLRVDRQTAREVGWITPS
jgi:hypothetical protein